MTVESRRRIRILIPPTATLFALLIGIQFIRPQIAILTGTSELQTPREVREIFRNSCYSCHSNQPRLSWFDEVAPAYWLVASDVKKAREHLNFSDVGSLSLAQQRTILFEAVNQIQLGAMPPKAYTRLHPSTVVKPEQEAVLRQYLTRTIVAPTSNISVEDAQFNNWIPASDTQPAVHAAPNGIEFIPEYKNWKSISSTERFDNHTMRVILGNDIAMKAIAQKHIDPWPDGTILAKVLWLQQEDKQGVIRTGAFQQVDFMIRDGKKYASTKNWGWARWRGVDLKPYGKGTTFTSECVGCHMPVHQSDYVYTMPVESRQ